MELKDAQFERLGDAAKLYPDSTLIIRKQFFDGVVSRFKDTIKTRTEMFIDEQKIRVGLAENLQKEYHKTFELKEEIRKQKYRRCLARSKDAETTTLYFRECLSKIHGKEDFRSLMIHYENQIQIHTKWENLWLKASEQYKQPLEFIEKDLET